MNAVVRSVDVGFGNVKYVKAVKEGKPTCGWFPSISYLGSTASSGDGPGQKRKTVVVPVAGLFYEVGPEIALATDRYLARHQHDDFTSTNEYQALLAGALYYMGVETIDLLVVGLPVGQFLKRRASLEKQLTREYDLGHGRKVIVKRVMAVAQPQGAQVDDLVGTGHQEARNVVARSLVVDVGYRTFDWLVTRGLRVEGKVSNSVPLGVCAILTEIARKIGSDIGEQFTHLEAIDEALRNGKTLRLYGTNYDLKQFNDLIQAMADQAVSAMIQQMDATFNLEGVLLVGGGAHLYRGALKRKFPKHVIREAAASMMANVRGFQLIGEQFIKEQAQKTNEEEEESTQRSDVAEGREV